MPGQEFRISAKNLGYLSLPDTCPRCFWAKCHLKLPYQIFPGIFSSLDSYQKKIIGGYFNTHNSIPAWLSSVGQVKEILPSFHHSKFCHYDEETRITLSGVPDDIFGMADGTLKIIDYKTAKYSGHQDSLFPVYRTQINGYALISEEIGLGKVAGLYLIYFEPVTDIAAEDIDNLINDGGFLMQFEAKILPVDLNRDLVPPLLKQARAIYDMHEPPEGRDGCKDCRLVGEMVGSVRR
ncbi:hypothetical protein ACFLQU_00930 [Verrucomicrobiota bacterium]